MRGTSLGRALGRLLGRAFLLSLPAPAFAVTFGLTAFFLLGHASGFVADLRSEDNVSGREFLQRAWLLKRASAEYTIREPSVRPPPPSEIRHIYVLNPALAEELGVPKDVADAVGEQARALSREADEQATTRQATVSFFYCEFGGDRHPGDGGGFCGVMRNGVVVHPGAAACDYKYLGQRFRIQGDPTGRVYECEDTGSAVHGEHRDIWFHNSNDGWAWQSQVGRHVTLEILP